MVEDVEAFKPQLDARVLSEIKVLVQSHVEVENPRTVDRVAVKVAEAPWRWRSKGGWVVPHGILSRRLIVAGVDSNWTTDVVRPNDAKASVAQVAVGIEVAT